MTNPYKPPQGGEGARAQQAPIDPAEEKAVQEAAGNAAMFSFGGLLCFAPLAFVGIARGNSVLRTIKATGAGQAYRSNAVGAVVVGYVAIAVWTLALVTRLL